MKNVKKNNGSKANAEKGKDAPKTSQNGNGAGHGIPAPITRELFREWCSKDLSAARAFLTALAKRPHLVEQIADEMYDSMQFTPGQEKNAGEIKPLETVKN